MEQGRAMAKDQKEISTGEKRSVRELVGAVGTFLSEAGIEEARRNAEWLVADAVGCRLNMLYIAYERPVSESVWHHAFSMAARRAQRTPVQYVLGQTDFFGLTLSVTPAVLIPRPETEEVVEEALHRIRHVGKPAVLDVGTGSGCIALAIRSRREDARLTGIDLSPHALAVARRNADDLGLPVHFLQADMCGSVDVEGLGGPFDLVVSNPPYIPIEEASTLAPEVIDHEPHLALFSGADPLTHYRCIVANTDVWLKPGGVLVLETHADFAENVAAVCRRSGLENVELKHDLARLPRMVIAYRSGAAEGAEG